MIFDQIHMDMFYYKFLFPIVYTPSHKKVESGDGAG